MAIIKIRAASRVIRIKDCRGISSLRGLMFDPLKDKDGALIGGNNVWMPFCRPLDLYFLDEKFAVIEKQKGAPLMWNPKTWKVYSNSRARFCLELKKGTAEMKPGEKVRFL